MMTSADILQTLERALLALVTVSATFKLSNAVTSACRQQPAEPVGKQSQSLPVGLSKQWMMKTLTDARSKLQVVQACSAV